MGRLLICLGLLGAWGVGVSADDRPNILWCMADDWGWPHAGAYGDSAVMTPAFDQIACEGVLFHQVYVSSPSCTPSRNALITGKYHWQLGPGANLHSTLPGEHASFIHLLRDQGYVTGRSNAKTWGPGNIQSWQQQHGDHPATAGYDSLDQFLDSAAPGAKPFFFWLGTSDPHRDYEPGSGAASGIDLARVHLFGHFPNAPEVRADVADYYFEVQRWDKLVGTALRTLEQRGLFENTIVIMTGDHGMPFPRCKGNLYDCGVRVPFAVRWGDRLRPGREILDFISLVDVAPTLLECAGVDVPQDMTGQSFAQLLRSDRSGRLDPAGRPDVIFGKERHVPAQEKPDQGGYPCRGLRTPEFLYVRNYRPDRWPAGTPEFLKTNYPDQWFADCDGSPTKTYIYLQRERDRSHRRSYELCFAKRPAEELYDLVRDPEQLHNVAADPNYEEQLSSLRVRLQARLLEAHDPRATDPDYSGFDDPPYLGGGGGKVPPEVRDAPAK